MDSVQKSKLKNGFTVLTNENINSFSVSLGIFIKCGSFDEINVPTGTAHFVEHMFFKGTKKRSLKEINQKIDETGGYLNAYTSYEETFYFCTVPHESWEIGTDILLDNYLNSTFSEDEIEKERDVIIEEIKMYDDDPSNLAFENLIKSIHKNQKNRHSITGTVNDVSMINKNELLSFVKEFYHPSNCVFVASGNIQHKDLVHFIETFDFSFYEKQPKLKKTTNANVMNSEIEKNILTPSIVKDINQAHLYWSVPAFSFYHKNSITLEILANILGGIPSSRFHTLFREELGLAYSIDVSTLLFSDSGFLTGYIGTDKENLENIKKLILEQLNTKNFHVSHEELEIAKKYTKGTFLLSLENNSFISENLGRNFLFDLENSTDKFLEEINSITVQDINELVQTIFSSNNLVFSQVIPQQ